MFGGFKVILSALAVHVLFSDRAVQSDHTRELSWINHSSFRWGTHWRLDETFTRSNIVAMG